MSRVKARLMSGIPEYLPNEQRLLDELKATISQSFKRFGFVGIETPTLELSEILLAKGGGETEKEIYRFVKGKNDQYPVLNRTDY